MKSCKIWKGSVLIGVPYIIMSSLFCVIIVAGNLIGLKMVALDFLGLFTMELSVGVLFYPITFLLTDLIVEFYGKQYGSMTIFASSICTLMIMGLVGIATILPASDWSPVSDGIFERVFNVYSVASMGSLLACFVAQNVDVYLFAFLKEKSEGRHLWLRNNVSTIVAQVIDTTLVMACVCASGILPWQKWGVLCFSGIVFKAIMSVLGTPVCYLGYYVLSRFGGQFRGESRQGV